MKDIYHTDIHLWGLGVLLKDTGTRCVDVNDHINYCWNLVGPSGKEQCHKKIFCAKLLSN